jgi:hypothetical protein
LAEYSIFTGTEIAVLSQVMVCEFCERHTSPPFGDVIKLLGCTIVKFALLTSFTVEPVALLALTFTVVEGVLGMVQVYDPVLAVEEVIRLYVEPPSVEYSSFTVV